MSKYLRLWGVLVVTLMSAWVLWRAAVVYLDTVVVAVSILVATALVVVEAATDRMQP